MHGQGYWPPPPPRRRPSTAVLVVLRVLFVALPLLSIGFLAWVSTLWAAIVARRPREWWVFGATVAVMVVSFGLLATDDTDDFSTPAGTTGMIILLLNACFCAGWFLYADVRHYQSPEYAGPIPPQHPAGYGYPHTPPPQPYAQTLPQHLAPPPPHTPQPPVPQPPTAPRAQAPQPPAPQPPRSATPPPQRPAPARIEQVRAELDELSDYLRRHGGGHGTGEGGR
ncbi:hypothetical protein DN402_20660 [Streptomyces sp. SW4]|nr:hypothetical protein DN402_20660 [Streptomyces sp. SW4]